MCCRGRPMCRPRLRRVGPENQAIPAAGDVNINSTECVMASNFLCLLKTVESQNEGLVVILKFSLFL